MIHMLMKIGDIKPNPANPRFIKDDKFKKLVQSLQSFPEMATVRPLVLNTDHIILGGNMRYKAAKEAGWKEIEVTIVDWPEDKQQEFIIKDNVSGGEWDWDELANAWDTDLLDDWGLDLPGDFGDDTEVEEDEAPEVSQQPPVSKRGEIYQLGRHRVMCGDSTADIPTLMNGQLCDMIFTDPPYGVDIAGGTHNFGSKKYRSGKTIENDTVDGDKLAILLQEVFGSMAASSKKGASVYITHADTFGHIFRTALLDAGYKIASCIVWVKHAFVFGRSDYKWQHEPMLYGWLEGGAHSYYGPTNETTVWNFNRPSPTDKTQHPTIKPVELIARAVNNSSKSDDIILDPFLGSGSTLIACEQTNRICFGMELDPKYVDVIRKRYAKHVGAEDWEAATPCV